MLPLGLTGGLVSLVQIIVPFEDAATAVADSVAGTPTDAAAPGDDARRSIEGLKHQVAALSVRNAELEREVEVLTATRLWNAAGGRIGARGRLVPADVVSSDLLPWRSSRLVTAGKLRGVQRGAAVTSSSFAMDYGSKEKVLDGMAVLLREALIGFVGPQVGTHTARVHLLSDVTAGMKVRIGRHADEGFRALDAYFWLTGCGRGVMEVREVDNRQIDDGSIAVGDVVLSDPMNESLPAAMSIGKITDIRTDRDNPLLSILTVTSEVDERALRRVYVYVPDAESSDDN